MVRLSLPGSAAECSYPPASKSVANWQTHFFAGHNSTCHSGLRMKLSLPTLANSVGKLANSMTVLELSRHKSALTVNRIPKVAARNLSYGIVGRIANPSSGAHQA